MARVNHIRGLFARLSQRDMRGPAFRTLCAFSKVAIFELDLHYWESDRSNPIEIPQRWLAELLGCSAKTAARVITELDDHGFLEIERHGKMKGPVRARAAVYRLTWQADNEGQKATFNNRDWQLPFAKSNAGNTSASTGYNSRVNAGRGYAERTHFRDVGNVSDELVERLKPQINRGS